MRPISLVDVKHGDQLAIRQKFGASDVTHRLLVVERTTAEQVVCRDAGGQAGEWRFLKSTGKQLGEQYRYAEIATPELIASLQEQADTARRRSIAFGVAYEITSRALHELTLPQIEALAKAWTDIKAMGAAAVNVDDLQVSAGCDQQL